MAPAAGPETGAPTIQQPETTHNGHGAYKIRSFLATPWSSFLVSPVRGSGTSERCDCIETDRETCWALLYASLADNRAWRRAYWKGELCHSNLTKCAYDINVVDLWVNVSGISLGGDHTLSRILARHGGARPLR